MFTSARRLSSASNTLLAPQHASRLLMLKLKWWLLCLALIGLSGGGGFMVWKNSPATLKARADEVLRGKRKERGVRVMVVHPGRGSLERITCQPGTVIAYEQVDLYSEVSGYLRSQSVDIGDRVSPKQVLAEIDVPE